ncbi:oxidoreductase [Streptomyces phaeochromogenes]|uniref:oxidoreductase n=1 Tax=Streptomyces phaeochromogenes TaxID=1923 RepID=UPI0036CEAC31
MSDSTEEPADLSPNERGMWAAFRQGRVFDARPDTQGADRPPPADLQVRADVLTRLLVDGPPALPGRVSSLRLRGLQITGTLDLSGLEVNTYVELVECNFERPVTLTETRMVTLRLVGCVLPGLNAEGLRVSGDLQLPRCEFPNGLILKNARVESDLLLNRAILNRNRRGFSLLADGLMVGQDLQAECIQSTGQISLADAQVGISCSFRGSQLRNPYTRFALRAPRLSVGRALYFSPAAVQQERVVGLGMKRVVIEGEVQLDDARIGDFVDLDHARLLLDGAFSMRRMHTSELRFCPDEIRNGRVVLAEATVDLLVDSVSAWPMSGMDLSGFVYKRLAPSGRFPMPQRIAWLEAATLDDYDPQPYEQLAGVLRAAGEPQDADTVLLARMRSRRQTLGRGQRYGTQFKTSRSATATAQGAPQSGLR